MAIIHSRNARSCYRFIGVVSDRKLKSASSYFTSSPTAPGAASKIPQSSKKGRLLTGATIGLVIAGGAYVSTVDEATFWYLIVSFGFLVLTSIFILALVPAFFWLTQTHAQKLK